MNLLKTLALSLSLATLAASASANLVVNGGFETGDLSEWTQFGDTGFTGVTGGFSGILPSGGSSQAYSGPFDGAGYLYQAISTVPGQQYTLSFDIASTGGDANSYYGVIFDGTLITSVPFDGYSGYVTHSFLVTAVDASTPLAFKFRNPSAFYLLDQVSLTAAVPEPASMAVLGLGLAALKRRRRSA